jgi:uncharacterized membrane protein
MSLITQTGEIDKSDNKWLLTILVVFGLIFCSLSLVNHYLFRTNAWDLGIFNKAMYDYAHLRWNISTVRIGSGPDLFPKNLLADHFELYPILFAPFYYLFGSYTLLLFQIGFVLWGGYGAYRFVLHKTGQARYANLTLIHFFCIWGVYTALAFDYHNNVVAAMGIPWFLYYFEKYDFKKAILVFAFMVIGKENMPLWLGFIGLALALWNFKDRKKLKAGILFSISGFLLFVLIIKIAIPAFAPPGGTYSYNTFQALGNNYGEILKTVILHPWYTFKLLFINHLHQPWGNGAKSATHIAVILSGGWAIFYRPKYLLMLLPIYGQKLFYDQVFRWGLYFHYSIEWAPIISIALAIALFDILHSRGKTLYAAYIISIIITIWVSVNTVEHSWARSASCFYSVKHYKRTFNVKEVYKGLDKIPEGSSVSAHPILVPHLSLKDTLYNLPFGMNVCNYYAFIAAHEPPDEITDSTLAVMYQCYADSTDKYKVIHYAGHLLIVKKKAKNQATHSQSMNINKR